MFYPLLILLVIIAAAIAAATAPKPGLVFYISKPGATILIILLCLLSLGLPGANATYTGLIALALLFSLAGDIALISDSKKALMIGLIFFLVAQIIYGANLAYFNGYFSQDVLTAFVILLVSSAIYLYFHPSLNEMKLPVAFYVLVISFMVWRAISTFFGEAFSPTQALLLGTGAAFFYVSDIILALYKFKRPFPGCRTLNLATYYAAQLLITLSTYYF